MSNQLTFQPGDRVQLCDDPYDSGTVADDICGTRIIVWDNDEEVDHLEFWTSRWPERLKLSYNPYPWPWPVLPIWVGLTDTQRAHKSAILREE